MLYLFKETFHFKKEFELRNVLLSTGQVLHESIPQETTTSDLAKSISTRYPHTDGFKLYMPYHEALGDSEKIWNVLKLISARDALRFAPPLMRIQISCEIHPDPIQVELDPSRILQDCIAHLCLTVGLRTYQFTGLKFHEQDEILDISKSLGVLNVTPNSHIYITANMFWGLPIPLDKTNEMSIWDELDTPATIQVDPKSVSGTLNKLCEKLTSIEMASDAQTFMKTFLITYPSFTTAKSFIEKLEARYSVPNLKRMECAAYQKYKAVIQIKVCNVLLIWAKKYPAGFLHPKTGVETCDLVIAFLDNVVSLGNLTLSKQIRKNITLLVIGGFDCRGMQGKSLCGRNVRSRSPTSRQPWNPTLSCLSTRPKILQSSSLILNGSFIPG